MPATSDWKVPSAVQPKPRDYAYDLDRALAAVVGVRSVVPPDAFSAETLGTQRAGNGALIPKDGLALTIRYLLTDAETICLTLADRPRAGGKTEHLSMMVAIERVRPILTDLPAVGQRSRPPRPWLGLYATEVDDRVVVVGLSNRGPAKRSDLRTGDVVLAVGGQEVNGLPGLFRRIWSLGDAGVQVPLTIHREGQAME